jgi:cytochrome c biogenesis protein CcdA
MLTLLFLGLLIGIAHAFEADHLAAVSALVSGRSKRGAIVRHGAIWGLGHTLSLLVVGGGVILFGAQLPERLATELELVVGIMLVGLGAHVLYRLHRDRVHFHKHSHGDGTTHFHLHSHASEPKTHSPARHHHAHPDRSALRTLAVGIMHGLAGSAALILVTAASLNSIWTSLIYIALFGVGSILGMALISALIALPLSYTARYLTRANGVLQVTIGVLTIGIGGWTIRETALALIG